MNAKDTLVIVGLVLVVIIVAHALARHRPPERDSDRRSNWPPEDRH